MSTTKSYTPAATGVTGLCPRAGHKRRWLARTLDCARASELSRAHKSMPPPVVM